MNPVPEITSVVLKKIMPLCSLIVKRNGTLSVNDAKAAPEPRATKIAGSAQHIRVELEKNKLK